MVADFQDKPFFEDLLKHLAAVVKSRFVRPHSRQSRNLAKICAVFQGLVSSPFHRLVDVATKHRLNDTKVENRWSCESLYRALSEKGNPSVQTLAAVLGALGARLGVARIERLAAT